MARDGTTRGLDLARGDPLRRYGLQTVSTEIQLRSALGIAMDTALMGLPELGSLRREQLTNSS